MGQKVHPIGFRVGIVRPWESQWYADKDYQKFLTEDIAIRKFIKKKFFVCRRFRPSLHAAGITCSKD